jgi:hypothetical protein
MDHHHSGMPAIHRPKTSRSTQRSHLHLPDQHQNPKLSASASTQSFNLVSVEVPLAPKAPEVEEEVIDEQESICPSPEQVNPDFISAFL